MGPVAPADDRAARIVSASLDREALLQSGLVQLRRGGRVIRIWEVELNTDNAERERNPSWLCDCAWETTRLKSARRQGFLRTMSDGRTTLGEVVAATDQL